MFGTVTNPDGKFSLFTSTAAAETETERFDTMAGALAAMNAGLGKDPVTRYVIDLAAKQEAGRIVWPGVEATPAAAPEAAPVTTEAPKAATK